MVWFTLRYDSIDAFKRQWPCHGLPDNLHSISVETAANGDLVDLEAYDENQVCLNTREFDGPALKALVDDCALKGDASN